MLCLIKDKVSQTIISCNTHFDEKKELPFQLWGTRPGDKNFLIKESASEAEIIELKGAIDYAVESGETALRLE